MACRALLVTHLAPEPQRSHTARWVFAYLWNTFYSVAPALRSELRSDSDTCVFKTCVFIVNKGIVTVGSSFSDGLWHHQPKEIWKGFITAETDSYINKLMCIK